MILVLIHHVHVLRVPLVMLNLLVLTEHVWVPSWARCADRVHKDLVRRRVKWLALLRHA